MGGEDEKLIRIPGETLLIKVSPEEEAYRKKYLPDPKKLTDEKLVCTVCSVSLAQDIHKGKDLYVHRALQVLVCEACYNFYGDGCFSADEDGDDKYCRWCGQGGTLYLCSACNCAFCQKCTKQNLKASVLAELENDDWKCYICNPRPLFGCRTICWGAQQLNKIGKEKEQERIKKLKERLEKLEAKKKETSERKPRKVSSSEDESSVKKRKRSSDGGSSSPEVMPKRKKRESRVKSESRNLNGSIGRRRKDSSSDSDSEEDKKTTRRSKTNITKEKIAQSTSDDDSDNKSKKEKLKKKKKRKDDSDESSDTGGKKKPKRRSAKKKDSSDDDTSEDEKLKKKKKLSLKKRGDSTDTSSDGKKKKKKPKKKKNYSSSEESSGETRKKTKKISKKKAASSSDKSSDEDESFKTHKKTKSKPNKEGDIKQDTADSDHEPKKMKKGTTDSEEVNTNSAEDILVKKRIKLAILWLNTIVQDISELGTLISLRATNFSKKKINNENLKSYDDVLNCVSKIKQLISGVHSNYEHIEKALDSHLKPWKILTGLEDADNEKNVDRDSSMAVDGDVSKADTMTVQSQGNNDTSRDVEVNGTLKESKVESVNNKNEENLNNWSDDSEDQNETRALISKANESLDKSHIEDEQSETSRKSLEEKSIENSKTDDKSIHEEKSNLDCDVKKSKEKSKTSKSDPVKSDSESELHTTKKNPSKDNEDATEKSEKSTKSKKDAESDNQNEESSPKTSSPVKNNSNEEKSGEKSEAEDVEARKEERESEGDKENKPLQSDLGVSDHIQESSEEDSVFESFALRVKDKWQSENTTEEMNLKQSLEIDSSNQSNAGYAKSPKDKVLEKNKEGEERIPKIVLNKLKLEGNEKEKTSPSVKSKRDTTKNNTKRDKSICFSSSEEEEENQSNKTKRKSVETEYKIKAKALEKNKEKGEQIPKIVLRKLNLGESEEEDKYKTTKSSKIKLDKSIKNESSQKKVVEDKKKTENKAGGLSDNDDEEGGKKDAAKRKVDKPTSKQKTKGEKSNCLSSSDEEEEKRTVKMKSSSSKTVDTKKAKEDKSERLRSEEKEKESDNRRSKRSVNKKETEDDELKAVGSKVNKKERKSKDKDASEKTSKKDKKEEESDDDKNNKTKSQKDKLESKSSHSKVNEKERKSKDKGSSEKTSKKDIKEEEESDDDKNNQTKSQKDKLESKSSDSKVNEKERKSKDKDASDKTSRKDKKEEEESDDDKNNQSKSQKDKLESKSSRKSKLKEYNSDKEETRRSKKTKLNKSKESREENNTSEDDNRKAKKVKKNENSSVGLDSSDDEPIDTAVVENGAESDGERSTGDGQENAETSHAEVQKGEENGMNCKENVSDLLELQAGSAENSNDIEMIQVKEKKPENKLTENDQDEVKDSGMKDEMDSKGNKTKFIGLDSSSDEEIKVEKKVSTKKRPVRNQKQTRNVLVLSSDDEEMGNLEKPTLIESSDEDVDKKEDKDDDYAVVVESSADSSDIEILPKNKRKKKGSSDSDASISEDDNSKKKKRRRIKFADSSDESGGSGDEKDISQKNIDGESPAKGGRKNIKKIKKKGDLEQTTIEAAEEERERRRRIEERQKLFNQVFEIKESAKLEKLVLDFDPETKKELISVHTDLVAKMKPHQAKGVKFMWDSCFESVKQIKKTKGSGCILAHCMGLGKTFQVISLIHTLVSHEEFTKVRTVMVVCPLSTVLNWVNEFGKWLEDVEGGEDVEVFHLTKYNKNPERARELRRWQHNGGVLIMGYEMFRNLTNETTKKFKAKLKKDFLETLIDPGADLIVCDEGHMLKNEATALSKAMTRVRTLRRIVLTGTPMQNNLKEYHCMVQFVKPNLLGTSKEFLNRFVNPINNGQFVDSTDHDVKLMKRRAHVLHKMLEGLVQRFDYNVLTPFLPPKQEYVISVCLSELQEKLYSHYMENESQKAEGMKGGTRLFVDWQTLGRVWTHPRVLKMSTDKANWLKEKKAMEESDSEGSLKDFIDDDSEKSTTTEDSSDESSSDEKSKKKNSSHHSRSTRSTRQRGNVALLESSDEEKGGNEGEEGLEDNSNKGEWWSSFLEPQHFEDMRQSGKLLLLFAILKECELIEDKVLVFSQSLFSLDLIEYFLDKIDAATQEGRLDETLDNHQGTWSKGLDYFRLDGSTSSENRNIWCKAFNREDNPRARLFLISTRAGGLGINLTAANRVIIFDASWNPSHDIQSIFRIYRFGQKKPCYVYRFVAHGTMEEKVYERQVAKQSISNRVVDEQQVHRHFSMNDLTELYTFTPASKLEDRPTPTLPRDPLMAEILSQMKAWIEKYHEHDSLLENVVEEELNEEERKAAWEDYENDKKRGFLPPAGPQGPAMNPNAAWNQQIEIMRQQLKLRYASKSDDEINSILVYQVSILMRQQQQQQQMMAAQMQAANNMGYRPQMYGNNMMGQMGGFNQRPQMQTTPYLRTIAPKPSSQQPNYTQEQVFRMQQQANMARLQMQQMDQQRKTQSSRPAKSMLQTMLGGQVASPNYPRATLGVNARMAAELQRMKQSYQGSQQASPGVTITEITDDKPSGSSEA